MSEYKYIIFGLAMLLGIPGMVIFGTLSKLNQRIIFFMSIFMSVALQWGTINFFSFKDYRGTSRGMEIAITELISISLLIILKLKNPKKSLVFFPSGSWSMLLFFVFCIISIFNAEVKIYAWNELWKLMMMYFFFITVYNYCILNEEFDTWLYAMAGIIIYSFILTIYQKYVLHHYQPNGLFPHQNSMAMFMGLAGPIYLVAWMQKPPTVIKGYFWGAMFSLASVSALLTFSRGAMVAYPVGCLIALFASLKEKITSRKIKLLLLIGMLAVIFLILIAPSMIRRLLYAPESSANTRLNLAKAAVKMANDKFIGVGLNNWGVAVNYEKYSQHRIDLNYSEDYEDGIVETTYLLIAAECGWIGLGVFLLMLATFYLMNLKNMKFFRNTGVFFIAAGLAGGIISIMMQSTLEWVLKQRINQAQLMSVFAVISCMAVIRKSKRH